MNYSSTHLSLLILILIHKHYYYVTLQKLITHYSI